jgi:hypothetical protein
MTKKTPAPHKTKKRAKVAHPGMMGDGTEEQNLGERGNGIKKNEVTAAFPQAAQKMAFVSISRPLSSALPRSIGKLSLATIPWPVSRTAAAHAASAVSMASTRMKRHVETKLIAGAPRAGHIGRTSLTSGIK